VKLIPKGKILTYKLVATTLRKPNAYRVVGTALNQSYPY
jgi:O6-methylguanine-DNA--protein-cysteine methyltransferase